MNNNLDNIVNGSNGLYQKKDGDGNMNYYRSLNVNKLPDNSYVVTDPKNQKFGIICDGNTGNALGKVKIY